MTACRRPRLLICSTTKDTNRTARCRAPFRLRCLGDTFGYRLTCRHYRLWMFPVLNTCYRTRGMHLLHPLLAGSRRYGDFVGGHGRCQQILRRAGGRAGTDLFALATRASRYSRLLMLPRLCVFSSSCHVDACVSIQSVVGQQYHR